MATPATGLDDLERCEQQILKLAHHYQSLELSVSADTRPDNISVIYDFNAQTVSVSFENIPFSSVVDANGNATLEPGIWPGV